MQTFIIHSILYAMQSIPHACNGELALERSIFQYNSTLYSVCEHVIDAQELDTAITRCSNVAWC
jgi:hypothetical protein